MGVSGGSDSVALLRLLQQSEALRLHVVHLDHETRAENSTGDARFVADLAARLDLACTVKRRSEIEPGLSGLPANTSARYRALRLGLFREVVKNEGLRGVILAHQADDQVETLLLRLLRGSTAESALTGMRPFATVGGLQIARPLLDHRRDTLGEYLRSIGQAWRDDASNSSELYQRNRLRKWLANRPGVFEATLALAGAMRRLAEWQRSAAPVLPEAFARSLLTGMPIVLTEPAARRWLADRGVPADRLTSQIAQRLLRLSADAAQPAQQHFPGKITVRRRGGMIFTEPAG